MRIIRKKKEIIPLPAHPALPTIPPDHKPHEEPKQTHVSTTEITAPRFPEIDIHQEEDEPATENEPVAE
jgi:hypothetical protein